MGLDFSHGDAHWSYSGFGHFRRSLWNLAGFKGDLYELYDNADHQIAEDHPLWDLFDHSDCDGELSPAQMNKIIPELLRLRNKLKDHYDRVQTTRLISGMRDAIKEDKPLKFQ